MNNFEKIKEMMNIEEVKKYNSPFCHAIYRLRGDENCDRFGCEECYKWLTEEYKEPILTESEKEYLSAVIKPWIDKADSIVKYNYDGEQFIQISIKDGRDTDLPSFKEYSMYKGMTVGKKYSLQELGILE